MNIPRQNPSRSEEEILAQAQEESLKIFYEEQKKREIEKSSSQHNGERFRSNSYSSNRYHNSSFGKNNFQPPQKENSSTFKKSEREKKFRREKYQKNSQVFDDELTTLEDVEQEIRSSQFNRSTSSPSPSQSYKNHEKLFIPPLRSPSNDPRSISPQYSSNRDNPLPERHSSFSYQNPRSNHRAPISSSSKSLHETPIQTNSPFPDLSNFVNSKPQPTPHLISENKGIIEEQNEAFQESLRIDKQKELEKEEQEEIEKAKALSLQGHQTILQEELKHEPSPNEPGVFTVRITLPITGNTLNRRFLPNQSIRLLKDFIDLNELNQTGKTPEPYKIVIPFPKKILDFYKTFQEYGITSNIKLNTEFI